MEKKLSLPARIAKSFVENSAMTWLLIVAAFGGALFSYIDSPKNHNPEIEVATFTLTIPYPGATAQEVERFVTKDVEQVLAKLPKVNMLLSQSYSGGQAVLFIKFEAKQNVEAIKAKVLSELQLVSSFTREYGLPEISVQVGGIEDARSIVFGFTSSTLSPTEIREKIIVLRDLMRANVPGLAAPQMQGAERRVIKIEPDPGKMQVRGIGPNDILNAINATNLRSKIGKIKNNSQEIEVEVNGTLQTIKSVKKLVLAPGLQLQDIAEVFEGTHESDQISEIYSPEKGFERAVFLSFGKVKGHNVTTLSEEAIAFVDQQMQTKEFKEIQAHTFRDSAIKARESTTELILNLSQTILIVFAVLLLFLKFTPALNVALSIPLVIAITLIVGYAVGQDINSVYLAGYILALGLLVDSATVVTEAIYRRVEQGLPKKEAVLTGIQAVGTGLVISTITSVIVFFPLLTLSGEMGEFFFDFGFVMPVALSASLFVALSLSPFLAYKLLQPPKNKTEKPNPIRQIIRNLNTKYVQVLKWLLGNKAKERFFLITVLGLVGLSFFLMGSGAVKRTSSVGGMASEFAVYIDAPVGTSAKKTKEILHKITSKIQDPRIKSLQIYTAAPVVGGMRGGGERVKSHQASIHGTTYEKSEAPSSAKKEFPQGILSTVRNTLKNDPEIQALKNDGVDFWVIEYPFGVPTLAPIVLEVRGPNAETRRMVLEELATKLRNQSGVTYVQQVTNPPRNEKIIYRVDEEKALLTGLSTQNIQQALSLALNTRPSGQLFAPEAREPIALEINFAPERRDSSLKLSAISLKNMQGEMVPLSAVVKKEFIKEDRVLYRRDQNQMDYLVAHTDGDSKNITTQFIKKQVINYTFPNDGKLVKTTAHQLMYDLPNGEKYELYFDGDLKQGLDTDNDFGSAILVALIMVYIVLVYQFKSFRTPLIIMSTIPLGFIGIAFGFIFLYLLFGIEMNPGGLVGILALIGIVVNNSIMILETYEQFKAKGLDVKDALIQACDQRFRPILLTSMTTFLGILTLLANESWQSLAIVVSAGLSVSVSITVFLIPVIYNQMYGYTKKKAAKKER